MMKLHYCHQLVVDEGSYMIELTRDQINPTVLVAKSFHPDCGAIVLFLGTVREFTLTKKTKSLMYEAYEPLALKLLKSISDQAKEKWKLVNLMVVHRLGCCKPMEIAVAVIATAPHRAEAFAACTWAIDEIKKTVPIWKEETDSTGNSNWIHPEHS